MALKECIVLVGEVVAGNLKERVVAAAGEAIKLTEKTADALIAKGIVKLATRAEAVAAVVAPKAKVEVKTEGDKATVTETAPAPAAAPAAAAPAK